MALPIGVFVGVVAAAVAVVVLTTIMCLPVAASIWEFPKIGDPNI